MSKNNHFTDMFGLKSQVLVNLNKTWTILNELQKELWVLKAQNYVQNVLQKYVICKGFEAKRYVYPYPSPLPCNSFSQTMPCKKILITQAQYCFAIVLNPKIYLKFGLL